MNYNMCTVSTCAYAQLLRQALPVSCELNWQMPKTLYFAKHSNCKPCHQFAMFGGSIIENLVFRCI